MCRGTAPLLNMDQTIAYAACPCFSHSVVLSDCLPSPFVVDPCFCAFICLAVSLSLCLSLVAVWLLAYGSSRACWCNYSTVHHRQQRVRHARFFCSSQSTARVRDYRLAPFATLNLYPSQTPQSPYIPRLSAPPNTMTGTHTRVCRTTHACARFTDPLKTHLFPPSLPLYDTPVPSKQRRYHRVFHFFCERANETKKTIKAVRAAQFHRHYPLMASASDDGSIHVFHATVYSDLLRNPLVVPLKILRGHEVR